MRRIACLGDPWCTWCEAGEGTVGTEVAILEETAKARKVAKRRKTRVWKKESKLDSYWRVFGEYDVDNDGYLSSGQVGAALESLGHGDKMRDPWTNAAALRKYSHNKLNVHEFAEFCEACDGKRPRADVDDLTKVERARLFHRCDEASEGSVTGADIFMGLRRFYRFRCSGRMKRLLDDLEASNFNTEKVCLRERDFQRLVVKWDSSNLNVLCRSMHSAEARRARRAKEPIPMFSKQ